MRKPLNYSGKPFLSTITFRKELVDAILDYKYFLCRKYPYKPALNLVVQRYNLTKPEKALLYRCIHDEETAKSIRKKLVDEGAIENSTLLIDGFNVLITISSAAECFQVFLCDDYMLRDVMKSFRKFKFENKHAEIVIMLISEIVKLKPSKTVFFFDKQVSFSGKVAALVSEVAKKHGLKNFETLLTDRNDRRIIEYAEKGIVSSSDIVILMRTPQIFDLAYYVVRKHFPEKIVYINKILTGE